MQLVKILGVAAVAWMLCACGAKEAPKKPPPREVEVLSLSLTEVRETGEYLGWLLSRQSVNMLPQVAGYVRRIHVRPGQKVEAGTPLLEVDAREETAALDSAQAQLRSAGANLDLALQTRARTEALFKEGLVSVQELEGARAQAEAAEASQRVAGAQVSQRAVQLQYFAVRAPFAGMVGDVLVRLGDFVTATTPLTSIAQADVLEVSVAVPADRARKLSLETPIEILDDEGRVLVTSPVYFVAPQADPRTQLVDVKAAFQNVQGLRPSEIVRARLVYGTRHALEVPPLAVVRQSGQAFVYAVERRGGQVTVIRRPVTLGPLREAAYVVEKGLEPGAMIAVSGIQSLKDGMPVQLKQAEARTAGSDGGGAPPGGSR